MKGYNRGMQILDRLQDFGFERTRRAVAALCVSFFVSLYLLLAINAPPGWGPAFLALGALYLVAFIGLAAEWFWGRWFASGLGWSGVMVTVVAFVMLGWLWPLAVYGGMHALMVAPLWGKRMAALYDMQDGWRQRYGMDEHGVARLRKTVTRAAASLPGVILSVLGPKDPGQGVAHAALLIGAAVAGIAGLTAVLRLRSWGVVALGASALALFAHASVHLAPEVGMGGHGALPQVFEVMFNPVFGFYPGMAAIVTLLGTMLPATLLAMAALPFAAPALRFVRGRR